MTAETTQTDFNPMTPDLTIVVPLLNESESLPTLYQEIREVTARENLCCEIIFVDDGSTDDSWRIVNELQAADSLVRGIRFRRNFAKAAALTAGMREAGAPILMMMDADLQDDPAEIPRMLQLLGEGFDVVNGWKQRRLDPWHKVYPSRVFNWLIGRFTGLKLHDHNCGLKMFRREVMQEIRIYGELHRFIAVLAHARGFRVAEMAVHHRPRTHGHSKYGVRRFLRGLLDLFTVTFLTGFGQRPQHMLGAIGLGFFAIGSLGLMWLTGLWVLMNVFHVIPSVPIGNRPLLAYSVAATLLGAQAITLGLMAELLVAYTGRDQDSFSVRESIGWEDAKSNEPNGQPEQASSA